MNPPMEFILYSAKNFGIGFQSKQNNIFITVWDPGFPRRGGRVPSLIRVAMRFIVFFGQLSLFTLTANAESWAVEAFLLCVFTSTKISEWSPMERRAPAQSSSRDQCI